MKQYYGKESAPPGSYNVPGALGRQVASTKESAPGIKIGTSLRALDYAVSWCKLSFCELIMTHHKCYMSCVKLPHFVQPHSSGQLCQEMQPVAMFTLNAAVGVVLQVARAKDMPGAGQYNTYKAVGKQPLSNKKTLPTYSFGLSTRDASKKTFISKEHEKQAFGMFSPGPGTAKPYTSSGAQQLSTKTSSPSAGFGTSKVSRAGGARQHS